VDDFGGAGPAKQDKFALNAPQDLNSPVRPVDIPLIAFPIARNGGIRADKPPRETR
jgi:hypothetical protein